MPTNTITIHEVLVTKLKNNRLNYYNVDVVHKLKGDYQIERN